MREDEIQVLGQNAHRERSWLRKNLYILIALMLLAAIVGAYLLYTNSNRQAVLRKVEADVERTSGLSVQKSDLYQIETTINGVHLHLTHVINMDASMTTDTASYDADNVRVMAAAAVSNGNDDIIMEGKVLARGKKHDGFCAIVNGNISIGKTVNDDVARYCTERKGFFFRQELLLSNGELQPSLEKGKAVRCALAKQGNDVYVVITDGEESLHDFANAMKAAGVTDAILLADNPLLQYKQEEVSVVHCSSTNNINSEETSYLIFKVRGDLQRWAMEEEEELD